MTYLFLGQDSVAKDKKLLELKKKYLPSSDSLKLDYEVLHAQKLDSETLKKNLIALPAIGQYRIVVVRAIEKLNTHNKELVLEFSDKKDEAIILVLDAESLDTRTSFGKKITAKCDVTRFKSDVKSNVFDITNAIEARRPQDALKMLTKIMGEGQHPLQIMGVLVWFWGKMRSTLKDDVFKKGLLELQEADLNIKRSRIKPDYAMEVLVTKLCLLVAC